MPGRAGGHEPKVRRTVIDKEPAQSAEPSLPSGSSAASDGTAVTQPGDAPGEASALHASARHRARAYYAVA
jgi:hypothetical protein